MADNLKGIPFSTSDEGVDYPQRAKELVYTWAVDGLGVLKEYPNFSIDDIYVVWFNYTLGGWKALCSTSLPDGRYYEVTHKPDQGDLGEGAVTFIDTYVKMHNIEVPTWLR